MDILGCPEKCPKKDPPNGMDLVPPHLIILIKLQTLQYNLLAYIVMIFLFSNGIFSPVLSMKHKWPRLWI